MRRRAGLARMLCPGAPPRGVRRSRYGDATVAHRGHSAMGWIRPGTSLPLRTPGKSHEMTSQQDAHPAGPGRQAAAQHAAVALRSLGQPNSVVHQFDFWDNSFEGRRLFAELLGTFFLVLVAVGAGMVNARFGCSAVPYGARVVAPALMVMAIILS